MKRKKSRRSRGSVSTIVLTDPHNNADDFADEAAGVSLLPIDESNAVARPESVGRFHVEDEYDAKAAEQKQSWTAAGERTAHDATVEAAGLKHQAEALEAVTTGQLELVDQSREQLIMGREAFWSHTRREKGDKAMYLIRMVALLFGDVAGVAGAAIMLGEVFWLAVIQGVSAGAAAVTAGVIGIDVKDIVRMRARKKNPKVMTDSEKAVAHHFNGQHEGEKIIKALVAGMLCVTCLLGSSVFALRSPTQGSTAAFAFALLAIAVSLASFLNAYCYSDEIASLLSTLENTYRRDLKLLTDKLIPAAARRDHAEAASAAASIKEEHDKQGDAAVAAMQAHKHGILRAHPGVAGHGTPYVVVENTDDAAPFAVDPEADTPTDKVEPPIDPVPYTPDLEMAVGPNGHHRSKP